MYVLNGNSEEIVRMFKPFGLTEYEARVYFTLQVCGRTRISRLWTKTGVPQSKIYQVIPALEAMGLVEVTPKFPKEVRAKQFLRFANDFLRERKNTLRDIERKISEHREVLKNSKTQIRILGD
ncbi:MAG: hypothetical protein GWN01_10295 [Nitrosopumilaceae archaeon]|nr:hypothetical protein [Nitrosopumilaceae archaeon]NIU01288.1 hypothetical protein [Nitrosopumilaceae archaeon]NIU87636.1 hypothetical protein [Nitrosopumilaceae archaeon]NIV66061.1 hypothetical protein [Nitrosopumilaceae archaeon]NIX61890.1 hypothetical protein [Nitrosopumilaceae archaeon]